MKNNKNNKKEAATKLKIIDCAVNKFAVKGFTETGVREIAAAVGIKAASIYAHFETKNSILEYILNDYFEYIESTFIENDVLLRLQKNPTPDGVLSCLVLSFPDDKKEYYLKILSVVLQEQHRNPLIREFVSKRMILRGENNVKKIIGILKDLNILRSDTDSDFWAKTAHSIFYAFSNRMLLGIGDMSPDFSGAGMAGTLKILFEMLFSTCGVKPGLQQYNK